MLPLRMQGTGSSDTVTPIVRQTQLNYKSRTILELIRELRCQNKQITCGGGGKGPSEEKLDLWPLCSVTVIKKGRDDL